MLPVTTTCILSWALTSIEVVWSQGPILVIKNRRLAHFSVIIQRDILVGKQSSYLSSTAATMSMKRWIFLPPCHLLYRGRSAYFSLISLLLNFELVQFSGVVNFGLVFLEWLSVLYGFLFDTLCFRLSCSLYSVIIIISIWIGICSNSLSYIRLVIRGRTLTKSFKKLKLWQDMRMRQR